MGLDKSAPGIKQGVGDQPEESKGKDQIGHLFVGFIG